MPSAQTNLLQGTLDLLILRVLALDRMHGLAISRRIGQVTNGTFQVKPGSLFPALYRMEDAGWIASAWGETETGRRVKYYRITRSGRRQLAQETRQWRQVAVAMEAALRPAVKER